MLPPKRIPQAPGAMNCRGWRAGSRRWAFTGIWTIAQVFPFAWSAPAADPPAARLPADTLPAELIATAPPRGLIALPSAPEDNRPTPARVALGRKLFFDGQLSLDRTVSCATCHEPDRAFAGREARAVGVMGRTGRRNAPSLVNRAYGKAFFWDGREQTLESQALRPIVDKLEMDLPLDQLLPRLQTDGQYPALFAQAYPDGLTADNVGRALASFERTLVYGDSPVDRFIEADDVSLLDAPARHGLWLFQSRAKCWKCHSGPDVSDEKFHNTGVSWGREPLDLGRFEVTQAEADRGRFKTPSLRNISQTAPYMHDGSLGALADVVEFYNQGGGKNPHLDRAIEPLHLTKEESAALTAFLEALTGHAAWKRDEP